MPSITCCKGLGQLLHEEQSLVEQLLAALEQEHQALVARAAEQLERVSSVKQQLLQQLEQGQQRRVGLLQEAGLTHDKAGLTRLLEQCAAGGHDYHSHWARLQESLQGCQQQNEINGKILESGRRAVHSTLSILLGGQGDGAELYTQEGKSASSKLGGHTIVKA